MVSYVTPKKGVQYIFYAGLPSRGTTGTFQSNPTIAAGDFKVSIDGGALANLATLPAVTPASSKMVKFTLSTSEMNGDNVTIVASDAAGAEWNDLVINIQTSARQVDDLAYPTTSGRSIDVTATGEVGIDWANIGSPTTTVNLSGTTVKTATDVETDTADIQTRLPAALVSGRIDASVGAMAANVLTATAINADAITAAKLAADVTTELQSGLATAANLATVDTVVDAIKAVTDLLPDAGALTSIATASALATVDTVVDAILVDTAEIGAAGAGLTALASQASVNTIDGIVDAILVDTAEIGVAGAGLTALASATNLATVDTVVDAVKVVTDKLDTALELDGAVYRYTTNALEQAPTGGSAPSAADIRIEIDSNSTQLAAIKAKTDNLPTDPADASVIAGRFDTLDTNLATVDTVADAIKAKTDNLPASPAATGDIPSANANADALLDRASGVETNRTIRQAMRLMLATLVGKISGAETTTVTIRDSNDTTNRVVATVDADGNRSSVTLDAS